MGHFSAHDIPNVLFTLVAAYVFGYLTSWLGSRKRMAEARSAALWALVAALAAALVRSQLPLAALVLAAAVLIGKRSTEGADLDLFALLLIGIGCGSGSSVIVGALLLVFIPIMRWARSGSTAA